MTGTASKNQSSVEDLTRLRVRAGKALFRAMARGRGHFHRVVESREVPPPVVGALLHLDEPMPMNTLADRIGCDPSYVTGIADRLEELGWVERHPWTDDRRIKQLVVTADGMRALTEITDDLFSTHPFLERLDHEETETLIRILEKAFAD